MKALTKVNKLTLWLKENIHSTQQLKNFVELASISAGESDDDIDKVLFFRDAISGYAPLILENNWTEVSDLQILIDACEKVINNLENDFSLDKKLLDSNRLLEWIKSIKERHGSVEESSMTTVAQINQSGEYIISRDQFQLEFKHLESNNVDQGKLLFSNLAKSVFKVM